MKKSYWLPLIIVLTTFILNSCKKSPGIDETDTNDHPSSLVLNTLTQQIPDWIEQHKTGYGPNKISNIQLFKENLDFSGLTIQPRNNGDKLIVIPIKDEVISKRHLNKNYLLNLLVVKNASGKIKWGTIVCYLPADSQKHVALAPKTIQHILNNESVEDDGTYKFLSLTGKFLYQSEFKDHKLHSWANLSNKSKDGKLAVNSTCTDWYLVTTTYYTDGSSDTSSSYLGTTCSGGCDNQDIMSFCPDNGGGGGSGGGGGTTDPDEPIDQLISVTVNKQATETSYEDEDLQYPDPATTLDGESGPGTFTTLEYVFPVAILFSEQTGQVNSITVGTPQVFPVNDTYYSGNGKRCTRYVLVTSTGDWAQIAPYEISVTWNYTLNVRYTYNPGGTSITRYISRSYTSPVTFH